MTGRKRMTWFLVAILCIALFGVFSFSAADSSLAVTSNEKTLKVVNGQTTTLHIGVTNDGSAEKKDITVTFPAEYQAAELAGKEAVFAINIVSVKEKPGRGVHSPGTQRIADGVKTAGFAPFTAQKSGFLP